MRNTVSYLAVCLMIGVVIACNLGGGLTRSNAAELIENDPRFVKGIKLNWDQVAVPVGRTLVEVDGVSAQEKAGVSLAEATFKWHYSDESNTRRWRAIFQKYDDGWRISYFTGEGLPIR